MFWPATLYFPPRHLWQGLDRVGISFHRLHGRWAWLLLAVVLIAHQTGCVRRRMTVRSNPPGAVVFVDERRIGVTPVSTSFTYYGTRNVQLVKDGYETVTEKHRVQPPWYQYPIIDFFAENCWPFEIRDERDVGFRSAAAEVNSAHSSVGVREQLRVDAQRGLVTPLVPP